MKNTPILLALVVFSSLCACSDDGSNSNELPDVSARSDDMNTPDTRDDPADISDSNDLGMPDADMSMANCDIAPGESTEDGSAGEGTVIGETRDHATFHSFGFEWDIEGDTDHAATVRVRYRKADACEFKEGMHLIPRTSTLRENQTIASRAPTPRTWPPAACIVARPGPIGCRVHLINSSMNSPSAQPKSGPITTKAGRSA